ncbi:hypothetical protein GCM10010269_56680 [Streptomyces humidus]|uniref:ChrR-like cupin domain-containing protein n=1 Tax=Streptomyces humidus TaxID=52259 RepID=A0A918L5K9_9ACTN|nr:hypothetical protein [Streptomyces humidus]GGS10219.1 hypothetical protein GCM10010269_56680 [Streptomyces humidus]
MSEEFGRTTATDEIPFQAPRGQRGHAGGARRRGCGILDGRDPYPAGRRASAPPAPGPAEVCTLQGAGRHPPTGEFRTGDYVLEPPNAVHDAFVFDEEVLMIMRSAGDVAFLNEDGSVAFMMDRHMLTGFAAA